MGTAIFWERGGELQAQGAQAAAVAHHVVERLFDAVERAAHDGEQGGAGFGQREGLRAAFEERVAEQFFQADDMAADRTLGHVERMGGGGKAEMPADGVEGAEGIERQPTPVERHHLADCLPSRACCWWHRRPSA
jgi:hypothetical protein